MTLNLEDLIEPLRPYVESRHREIYEIPPARRAVLDEAVRAIRARLDLPGPIQLTFICTANSRRSHLGQVWAAVAAHVCGLDRIETYSGGTEISACNVRTVRALRRAGLSVARLEDAENPVYWAQYSESKPSIQAFSKLYAGSGNPTSGFIAMMCCSEADEACPAAVGANGRIPLHYDDPKSADDTPQEPAAYDERSRQIATEMLYVMTRVKA